MRRIALLRCVWSALSLFSSVANAQDQAAPLGQEIGAPLVEASDRVGDSAPSAAAPPPPTSPPSPSLSSPAPTHVVPTRHALQSEYGRVEMELARLKSRRPRLGLPIMMIVGGWGVGALFGAMSIAVRVDSRRHEYRWDENGNRYLHRGVDAQERGEARRMAAVSLGGLGFAALGVVLFTQRLKARRAQLPVLRPLQERRRELLHQLGSGLSFDRGQVGLVTRFSF